MRGMILVMFALFIDGLQAAVTFGFYALSLTAGTTGGCLLGYKIAGRAGCYVGGLVGILANAPMHVAAGPIGVALGIGTNIIIAFMLGGGLIVLLTFSGMFYPKYIFSSSLIELVPGVNNLPSWTFMVVRCIMQKNAEEGKGGLVSSIARSVASTLTPMGVAGAAFKTIKAAGSGATSTQGSRDLSSEGALGNTGAEPQQRLSTNLRNIDGVRPVQMTPARTKTSYAT